MVKITGAKAHKARLKRIRGAAMRAEVGKAIHAAADYLSTEAANSITRGSSGGSAGGKHQHIPSRPGEPPNADKHTLDRSIHTESESQLRAMSVADARHAVPLELGTSKMAARPFMQPAAEKTRKQAQRLVQAAVKIVANGGSL